MEGLSTRPTSPRCLWLHHSNSLQTLKTTVVYTRHTGTCSHEQCYGGTAHLPQGNAWSFAIPRYTKGPPNPGVGRLLCWDPRAVRLPWPNPTPGAQALPQASPPYLDQVPWGGSAGTGTLHWPCSPHPAWPHGLCCSLSHPLQNKERLGCRTGLPLERSPACSAPRTQQKHVHLLKCLK